MIDDLKVKYDTLDNLFLTYLSWTISQKFVMGKYWRQMDIWLLEKHNIKSLFKRYALALYKSFPLTFKDNINFAVTDVIVKGTQADVITEIKVEGQEEAPFNRFLLHLDLIKKIVRLKS